MEPEQYKQMSIHTVKIDIWIKPELLAQLFSNKFGIKGLSWLDSDESEHGEWSVLGVNPKEVITCTKDNNIKSNDNPFKKLQKIQHGFWMGWLSYEAGAWLEPQNDWHNNEVATYCAIEIIRRLIGYAQLPIKRSISEKSNLLKLSKELIIN